MRAPVLLLGLSTLVACPAAPDHPEARPAATAAPVAPVAPAVTGPRLLSLAGTSTTGMPWQLRVIATDAAAAARAATLTPTITAIHKEVVRQLDGRNPESELGRVSRTPARRPLPVSRATLDVLATALDVARRTDGAFDPTAGPLRTLWGLDPFAGGAVALSAPPAGDVATQARARVGHARVREVKGLLQKDVVDLEIDLSSLVDAAVAATIVQGLRERAFERFVVEVGDVVVAVGEGLDGPWALKGPGLVGPVGGATVMVASRRAPATTLTVAGTAVRPIIDPRTARPVTHDVDSCRVVGTADGDVVAMAALAEACLVVGEEGLAKVRSRFPGVALTVTPSPDTAP